MKLICGIVGFLFLFLVYPANAQRKYAGVVTTVKTGYTFQKLLPVGISFKEAALTFAGSDTLKNGKILYTTALLDKIVLEKAEILIEKGMVVQFQVNTFDKKNSDFLKIHCEKSFGKPKKSTVSKNYSMLIWDGVDKNNNKTQSVLIIGHKGKRAELVTWIL